MSSLLWTAVGFAGAAFLFLLKLLEPLLQKDLEEGVPWFAAWLVRRAVRKLPAKHQQRFEEEWLAELAAVPGVMVFKLRFAAAVSLRARSTSRAMQNLPPWWEKMLRQLVLVIARAWNSYFGVLQEASRKRPWRPTEPVVILQQAIMSLILGITRLATEIMSRVAMSSLRRQLGLPKEALDQNHWDPPVG